MHCANDDCPDWVLRRERGEDRAGIERCPRCGEPLREGAPAPPADEPPIALDGAGVTVARVGGRAEAEALRGVLGGGGIRAVVVSDDCGGVDPALSAANAVRVLVAGDDLAAAREILDAPPEPSR